jgi:hypothetical protein
MAECLFDCEYRVGSSLNEVTLALLAVRNAAVKMQCDAQKLWFETCNELGAILKANEKVVRRIASELMRRGEIKSQRLAHLLKAVRKGQP